MKGAARKKIFWAGFFVVFSLGYIYAQEFIEENITEEENYQQNEELISLDLKNVDLVELLKILSIKSGKTIIPSKEIKGRMTIFLNKVTFQDTLDVILLSQDLAYSQKDNMITVMTSSEYESLYGMKFNEKRQVENFKLKYAKPDDVLAVLGQLKSEIGKVIVDSASGTFMLMDTPQKLQVMRQAVKELDQPLETIVFDLNYSDPVSLEGYLANFITPNVGKVVIDERTDKVVVFDLPQRLNTIKELVKAFDETSRQVEISTVIIEVTLSDRFQRGIDWQRIGHYAFRSNFPASSTEIGSAYGKITVGELTEDDYYGVMNFLQAYGDTKIISQPRMVVVNNEEARFMLGTRQAYVTQTQSQAQSSTVTSEAVEFIDVGVKLNVTPTINKKGFITMRIKPEVSSVSSTLTTSLQSKIPIVDTSESETVVKVKDGETLMIAGLLKDQPSDTVNGVPGLCRLPIIGGLFSSRDSYKTQKKEFIVFLTPRILKPEDEELCMVKVEQPGSEAVDGVDLKIREQVPQDQKKEDPVVVKQERLADKLWEKMKKVSRNQSPVTSGQSPETSSQKTVTSGQSPETSSQKPVASGQSPETSSQKPVASDKSPETSGQKLEE